MALMIASGKAEKRTAEIVENDVTGLDKVPVLEVVIVRSNEDVISAIERGRKNGIPVAARGTGHSMGGHCLPRDGILLDMSHLNQVLSVDTDTRTAVVQAGATWGDLISAANEHGLSPTVMQSYCTFSVGGSLSVNAHGGSSNLALHSAVQQVTVISAQGEVVDAPRGSDLYKHVIGGYGLFGIIVSAVVDLIPNVRLSHKGLLFSSDEEFFEHYVGKTLRNDSIVIKRGLLDLNSSSAKRLIREFERIEPDTEATVVSPLAERPRELTKLARFMFKWVLPTPAGRELRRVVERITKQPADHQPKFADSFNLYLYESAESISHLYTGMIKLPDTFVLHEYFIPLGRAGEKALEFTKEAREVVRRWKKRHWMKRLVRPCLLNTSVRAVYQDKVTALPYAPVDSIAFVMYFRLRPSSEGMLAELHNDLVNLALNKGGTFYLPYRLHYSMQQLHEAYPQFESFRKAKRRYDAANIFCNEWWYKYRTDEES